MYSFISNFINKVFPWLFGLDTVKYMLATVIVLALFSILSGLVYGRRSRD